MKFRFSYLLVLLPIFFGIVFFGYIQNASATNFIVDSTADTSDMNVGDGLCDDGSGICTLRAAIEEANTLVGPDDVYFNIGSGGLQTIAPLTPFPTIIETIYIAGETQSGYGTSPLIEISGSNIPGSFGIVTGLRFINSDNYQIDSLIVNGFSGYGISFESSGFSQVSDSYIGTDATGMISLGNLSGGISISQSHNIGITRNVISGNLNGPGISFHSSNNNVIYQNKIGTDVSGNTALPNTSGIIFDSNSNFNNVGLFHLGFRNIISGNSYAGIFINNSNNNTIRGNHIGVDYTGTIAIPNAIGVDLYNAQQNHIGIGVASLGNVISANTITGIRLYMNSDHNTIQRNYIGTNNIGSQALGNGIGVSIISSSFNLIGGTTQPVRNIISGNVNGGSAIYIEQQSNENDVQGNFIGTNLAGTQSIPNETGITINDSMNNRIGGAQLGMGNLISGNGVIGGSGINLNYAAIQNTIQGNKIGTDVTGMLAIPNQQNGIMVFASDNIIGGLTSGAANLISGNGMNGIAIYSTSDTLVQGNKIGTTANGTSTLPNIQNGIYIAFNAHDNIIGGAPQAGSTNLISGNAYDGVKIDFGSYNNTVENNYIGTDTTGTVVLPQMNGVSILLNSYGNVLRNNLLSGHAFNGVVIDWTTHDNKVYGNKIGTNLSGMSLLGNVSNGIDLVGYSNIIGGSNPGEGNLISGSFSGINVLGHDNSIKGNKIGTNVNGTAGIPNQTGMRFSGANNNLIGGSNPGEANIIAYNQDVGLVLNDTLSNGNKISRNSIFDNGGLGIDLIPTTGVTPNDSQDIDTGGNNLQNYPTISPDTYTEIVTSHFPIQLNSTPNTPFTIEFFISPSVDSTGYGEGKTYLTSMNVTTDANGNIPANTMLNMPRNSIVNQYISATATDPNGNTSEFSNVVRVDNSARRR